MDQVEQAPVIPCAIGKRITHGIRLKILEWIQVRSGLCPERSTADNHQTTAQQATKHQTCKMRIGFHRCSAIETMTSQDVTHNENSARDDSHPLATSIVLKTLEDEWHVWQRRDTK